MSETTIGACPVCGETEDVYHNAATEGHCRACGLRVAPDAWNRLSRAAALLRACEAIEVYHRTDWRQSIAIEVMSNETIGIYAARGAGYGATLADALRALAGEVER
jgi:hypothetical protein